jgi:protocatechuate 3,4-dioxygenase beta subunit
MTKRTTESLLDDVLHAYDAIDNERKKALLKAAIKHLHAFAKEVDLTRDEWMAGIELLTAIGQTCTEERQEFILLSDLLGVSSLVELQTRKVQGKETPGSVVGPFHLADSPLIPIGGSIDLDHVPGGESVHVSGRVIGIDGEPIKGAILDIWQTAPNMLYALQDENQSEHNLRGKQITDNEGRFSFITTKPVPYSVPTDGPCGEILKISNRHGMRVAHIHFGIEADGYKTLITEIFAADDPRLDSDTVFGARPELLMEYKKNTNPDLDVDLEATYEFVLRPIDKSTN